MGGPEIEALALLVLTGVGHRVALRSADPVEVQTEQAIAERVMKMRVELERVRDKNLATMIGNAVGRVLGGK